MPELNKWVGEITVKISAENIHIIIYLFYHTVEIKMRNGFEREFVI